MIKKSLILAAFVSFNTPILAQASSVPTGHYHCVITSVNARTDHTIEALQIRSGVGKTFEVLLYDQMEGNVNRYLTLIGHEAVSQNFHSDGSGSQDTTMFKLFAQSTLYTINFYGATQKGSIDLGFFDELAQFTCTK